MDVATLKVLTIPQIAKRCQIEGIPLGEGAIRRLVRRNEIPTKKIGRKALIRWEDVMGLFASTSDFAPTG